MGRKELFKVRRRLHKQLKYKKEQLRIAQSTCEKNEQNIEELEGIIDQDRDKIFNLESEKQSLEEELANRNEKIQKLSDIIENTKTYVERIACDNKQREQKISELEQELAKEKESNKIFNWFKNFISTVVGKIVEIWEKLFGKKEKVVKENKEIDEACTLEEKQEMNTDNAKMQLKSQKFGISQERFCEEDGISLDK